MVDTTEESLAVLRGKKIAIVHDFFMQYGGAERVVEALHALFPEAPVHALLIDRRALPASWGKWDLRAHPLLRWLTPFGALHKALFFIYPWFVERWDFSEYDLVITSSYSFAHGVNVRADARHVCYCYVPMRFIWLQREQYETRIPSLFLPIYRFFLKQLRAWDLRASKKPKIYLAISEFTANAIKEAYKVSSKVVFPPVDISKFKKSHRSTNQTNSKPYFLIVSRLVLPHKRIDLAIHAANTLKVSLKIVGEGSDRVEFEKISGPTIQFMGRVEDAVLRDLYENCRALILCWEEEFGIAPVEANQFGKPVIAYRGGGALDTQIEGMTAIFFNELTEKSLRQAMEKLDLMHFDSQKILRHADQFLPDHFRQSILSACLESDTD